MQRRELISLTFALAGAVALRKSWAQPAALNRAAVVIGVNKAGSLPVLSAAASGADAVAQWLTGEGFEVKLLTDAAKPVRAIDVFDAIAALVGRGNLDQLLIYFAGHGSLISYSEFWLLSGAPDNPNEAVCVYETIALAHQTSIPNVVFISDACRSRAEDLNSARVRGSLVFPNKSTPPTVATDVDVFYATAVGDPAWEIPVQKSIKGYEGIFTATLLDAYKRPDTSMVSAINDGKVVTNAKLKTFLLREVPLRAQAASIDITQRPDVQITSGDQTFLGHVTSPDRGPSAAPPQPVTLTALATESVNIISRRHPPLSTALRALDSATGFSDATQLVIKARGAPETFAGKTGFSIFGEGLSSVSTHSGVAVQIANLAADRANAVVDLGKPNWSSVALRFGDGCGCLLAALKGFIVNVVVGEHGINSVTYEPSRGNPLRYEYDQNAGRISQLHATVATAARFGVFRIEGGRNDKSAAAQMGDSIRVMKGVDATLGLYAAYAYAGAGLKENAQSVNYYMKVIYGTTFFDTAMLADQLSSLHVPVVGPQVPFAPMLSQGWNLLRVKNIHLPEGMEAARDHLKPSLWTTFDAQGMDLVQRRLPQLTKAPV